MFWSQVFFRDSSNPRSPGKRTVPKESLRLKWNIRLPENLLKRLNSLLLAEGEGATATSLVRPSRGGKKNSIPLKIAFWWGIIHRVPSIEGATATSLVKSTIYKIFEFIARKNAPDELSLFIIKQKRRTHWSTLHI